MFHVGSKFANDTCPGGDPKIIRHYEQVLQARVVYRIMIASDAKTRVMLGDDAGAAEICSLDNLDKLQQPV